MVKLEIGRLLGKQDVHSFWEVGSINNSICTMSIQHFDDYKLAGFFRLSGSHLLPFCFIKLGT